MLFYLTDDDECKENSDTCDKNAICTNTVGSFTCKCTEGYTGTGQDGECQGKKLCINTCLTVHHIYTYYSCILYDEIFQLKCTIITKWCGYTSYLVTFQILMSVPNLMLVAQMKFVLTSLAPSVVSVKMDSSGLCFSSSFFFSNHNTFGKDCCRSSCTFPHSGFHSE